MESFCNVIKWVSLMRNLLIGDVAEELKIQGSKRWELVKEGFQFEESVYKWWGVECISLCRKTDLVLLLNPPQLTSWEVLHKLLHPWSLTVSICKMQLLHCIDLKVGEVMLAHPLLCFPPELPSLSLLTHFLTGLASHWWQYKLPDSRDSSVVPWLLNPDA